MAKARRNGAGCRYDDKNRRLHTGETMRNGGYEFKYYDICGKRKSLYAKTLTELREKEANINKHQVNGRNTVDQVMQECFKHTGKLVSTKTLIGYEKTYNRYIQPVFGEKYVGSIKPIDVEIFYASLHEEKKLKVSTIATVHAVLHRILRFAKDAMLIPNNPADGKMRCLLRAKRAEHMEKPKALEREVRDHYLQYLVEKCDFCDQIAVIYLMAKFGFRCGEVVGLTESDVDYGERVIHVTHTLSYGYTTSNVDGLSDGSKCGYVTSDPKTLASRRSVPCDDEWILAQLKKCERRNRRIKRVNIGGYKGFIFVKKDGRPYTNKNINDYLQKTASKYNAEEMEMAAKEGREPLLLPEKLTCHIFRRTVATLLNDNGFSLADIQALLGHVDVGTTNERYCCPGLERARFVAKSLI